jgi:tetratricopeptide (TPR) repeat protein
MADAIEQRDFFISFNSADLAYAEAIDAALREAGFSTFFHLNDLPDGGNIIIWMDEALMNSAQTLALFSPDYTKDKAVYSKIERYASLWQDPGGDERKLIPILLRETTFSPLIAPLKRIDVSAMTRHDASAYVVNRLKTPLETKERDRWSVGLQLPKVFNVLYRRNPNFTGRLEAMESLQRSLREGNAAITAVAGTGGVGKTTLAAEYCHRFGGRYGGVWWVRAEQESVMLSDLAALGQRLGLDATGNIEADVRAAIENVASRTEPWLMVYDNAPNADAVSKWLPVGGVRCLITSRFAGFDGVAAVTKLDQWTDEVTADYLILRTDRDDNSGALRLAHSIGGLPLAAEQAAVFLKDRKGISFDDYTNEIARLIKEERPAGAKGDYPDTVYAAFVKSLKTLDGMNGGKTALAILHLCAFLAPDGVDLALLLIDMNGKILPADFSAAIADKFGREDALAALTSLSLLRQEDGPMGPVLIFHRLLLEVMRDWMGVANRDHWGAAALGITDSAFPYNSDDDPTQWPVCARLMPHVTSLEAYVPLTEVSINHLGSLLHRAGLYLRRRGDRAGALAMAEKSLILARQAAENPRNIAAALSSLGLSYFELGRLDDAEAYHREAVAAVESFVPADDPQLAIILMNLAQTHARSKKFASAVTLISRVAQIMKLAYGADSPEYAYAISNIGAFYVDWSIESGEIERRKQGEEYIIEALTITKATRGVRHPHTALSYHNLAATKSAQADWADASVSAARAVAIMLSLDLAHHPHTSTFANELISSWQQNNQSENASRILNGDVSNLLAIIKEIETEHRAWVAKDPNNRHFGPPSPYAEN